MRRIGTLIGNPWVWIPARLALFVAGAALLLQGAPSLVSAQNAEPPARRPAAVAPAQAAPATLLPAAAPTREAATAMLSTIRVTRELQIPHWLRPGEFVWNDDDAPTRGETVIVVNIRARVLSVYRAGVEIGRSNIVYGADNRPTPTGTFPILEKDADRWSRTYDAPMPHALRLTADWIAIHGSDATGDDAATRGCVGLPREFAQLLFGAVRVGDRVVIWDGVTTA